MFSHSICERTTKKANSILILNRNCFITINYSDILNAKLCRVYALFLKDRPFIFTLVMK